MVSGTKGQWVRPVVAAWLAVTLLSTPGAALSAAESGGELLDVAGWTAVGTLLLGTVILVVSIEVLIHALVRTAVRLRLSAFLLAVVFSGVEFDNVAFGVFTGFQEFQDVAFGLAIGNSISIFGLTLALGALLVPFEIDVPRDYLALVALAPLVLVPFLLLGSFTATSGALLLGLFVLVFGYIVRRERAAERTFMRSEEVVEAMTATDGTGVESRLPPPAQRLAARPWFWPAVLVVALAGVVVGAEASTTGVEGILSTWNLTGTFLGVTVVTLLYTLDDLLLILEPLRLGYHDIAVGGVVGSILFFVTANVGLVSLIGTVHVTPATLWLHFPVLAGVTWLSCYYLYRGRLTRRAGASLLGVYVAYLLVNVLFLSGLPVEG